VTVARVSFWRAGPSGPRRGPTRWARWRWPRERSLRRGAGIRWCGA